MSSDLYFGPFANDIQERINFPRMREQRTQRTRDMMRKHGLAALILYDTSNMRYATAVGGMVPTATAGIPWAKGLRFALVFAEHDPIVYEHADIGIQQETACPWIKPENMRCAHSWLGGLAGPNASRAAAKKWAQDIKRDLEERGLLREKLGADGLDPYGAQALRDAGITVVEGAEVMAEARMIKTDDEINCLKMAAAITDRAWYKVYEAMKPGVMECELLALAHKVCLEMGAEGIDGHVKSGPTRTWPNYRGSAAIDRIIEPGDIVYIDLYNVSYSGYLTCYYRTFIVGREPTAKEKEWYKQALEWLYGPLEEVKPGKTTADAAKRFPPVSLWGYKGEEYGLLSQWAHGIGLGLYEKPLISRAFSFDDPVPFEKGMTFAIETQQGEKGLGGVRIEEEVVVTETGCEVITRFPIEEITVVRHSLLR